MVDGYHRFRDRYASGDSSVMYKLAIEGQKPTSMIVACCDSRVDPALILQCDPGELFVVRNVANIVPPYEKDNHHHGTSAALEFGIKFLEVKHLILLGHSQCGGLKALLAGASFPENDFISSWVSLIDSYQQDGTQQEMATLTDDAHQPLSEDSCAKLSLHRSYKNCLTFPWIKERLEKENMQIHRWFFDIKTGLLWTFNQASEQFETL